MISMNLTVRSPPPALLLQFSLSPTIIVIVVIFRLGAKLDLLEAWVVEQAPFLNENVLKLSFLVLSFSFLMKRL